MGTFHRHLAAILTAVLPVIAPSIGFAAAIISGDDFTVRAPPNASGPGVYGIEVRGGNGAINGTWELGVGNQTSVTGQFNQGQIAWGTAGTPTMLAYTFDWAFTDASKVTATIGSTVVSFMQDWDAPNGIQLFLKRKAALSIADIETSAGITSLNQSFGNATDDTSDDVFLKGPELAGGWRMTGTIELVGGGNSANEVLLKVGGFPVRTPEPAPLALLGVGLAAFGLSVLRRI